MLLNPTITFDGLAGTVSVPLPPPGRITLTTAVPVTTSDVTGATTVYYVSVGGGKYLTVYNGASWSAVDVSAGLSFALDSDSGHTGYHQADRNFDVWFAYVSGTTYYGTGPAWNDGAGAGSNTARGTGAGSSELELYEGMYVNKNSMTLRHGSVSGNTVTVPVRQAVLLGTIRMTANGQTEDSLLKRFVSNVYNILPRPQRVKDGTATWAYSNGTVRQANGNAANQIAHVQCLPGRLVDAHVLSFVNNSTATQRNAQAGVGVDATTADSAQIINPVQADNVRFLPTSAFYKGFPGLGYHYLAWVENGTSTADTITFIGTASFGTSGLTANILN